jgi:hypothetical protein
MAIQCTICGTQTRPGAKFCHTCGTPIATTSLPSTLPLGATPPVVETRTAPPPVAAPTAPQPAAETEAIPVSTAYLPQTPQTYHAPPPLTPVQPANKSGKTLKVVLISFALLIVLGIASVIGAVYFVSKKAQRTIADIKQRGGFPTMSSNPESVPDEKLGVPIYPGAKRENTVSGSLGSMSGAVVTFSTKDSVEEVATFYREHFKENKDQSLNEVSDSGNSDGSVVFQVNGEGGSRLLTISPHDRRRDLTEIVVIIGNGVPGMTNIPMPPPPPPPPHGNAAERRARDIERRALEKAEKVLRDLETTAPPPPPAPKR